MDVFFVLYLTMTPVTGGASVTFMGGVMATPQLCQMAGSGIEAQTEAQAPDVDVTFVCHAERVGVAA
jgi:Rieske Fe-S protein